MTSDVSGSRVAAGSGEGPDDRDGTYDFDLHGIVRVRLLGATPDDVRTVTRQLGPLLALPEGSPDVVVHFTDRITDDPVTYVGLGDTGFCRQGFVLLGDAHGRGGGARTLMPFADLGDHPQIVCEHGASEVPHLLAVVNLTALGKGVLPLHASAFTFEGLGVLVTGWSKGGKTECLLACMEAGAEYVGDEWVYLAQDGRMWGVPEPIRLWAWHFDQQPHLLRARPRRQQSRLRAWQGITAATRAASAVDAPGAALARRAAPGLARQAYLQVPPAELFGADRVALQGRLDAVVLLLSHETEDITTRPTTGTEVAGRMLHSLAAERAPVLAHYHQYRYALPERRCAILEEAGAREAQLLAGLLDHRPAAAVSHPYPCDIGELGRAVMAAATEVAAHRGGEVRP